MTYQELKKIEGLFRPALILDTIISHYVRKRLTDIFLISGLILFIPSLFFVLSIYFPAVAKIIESIPNLRFYLPGILGLFYANLVLWIIFFMAESFFYSTYFLGLDAILTEHKLLETTPISFEVASVLSRIPSDDPTKAFLLSSFGRTIAARVGILIEEIDDFLSKRPGIISAESFTIDSVDNEFGITLADFAVALYRQDKAFKEFLFNRGIQEKDLEGAALWVVRTDRQMRRHERWWSRDNLGKIPGIGKDWAYGETYIIDKYGREISGYGQGELKSQFVHEEVESLERILSRSREANALLVGNPGGGAMDAILSFAKKINDGFIVPPLEHKRVYLLEESRLVDGTGEKIKFEKELTRLMNQALEAGNIILVFSNFPSFVASAASLGTDIVASLDPYLASGRIQIIAIADPEKFHRTIETNPSLMARFEIVRVKNGTSEGVIGILEDETVLLERHTSFFFTYPALEAIVESALRYFPDATMPDKAVDLLSEIIPQAGALGKALITKDDVLKLVQVKTGIPTGKVEGPEKEKLMNLEEILHKRVIGQDEAVVAISGALRRARSGIGNPNRPIGSFLFLGPTGVGKTETTKALAEAFFGSENNVARLDMSEYKGIDAMDKLIGSFGSGRPGVLSNMLREHPYGVLLLDEFEKTTKDVMDLFLQVLDEGFFSDMSGKRVNARNLMIIATSNAGSDLIWELMQKGVNLNDHKNEIIDTIVKSGIYKPELLNRFDGVIIFHPVEEKQLRTIAELMLKRLQTRLEERGIKFVVNDAVIAYLMKYGTDPKFGARPMNRAVQDKIEQVIADKIIKGDIQSGSEVELKEEDLK